MSTTEALAGRIEQAIDRLVRSAGERASAGGPSVEETCAAVAGELAAVRDELRSLSPGGLDARLGPLSTRLAVAFFVERNLAGWAERVVDELVAAFGAAGGALVLFDDAETARVVAARDDRCGSLSAEALAVSRSMLRRVFETGEPVLVEDTARDAEWHHEESIAEGSLRSVLVAPVVDRGGVEGAVQLDHREPSSFDESERELLVEAGRLLSVYLGAVRRREPSRAPSVPAACERGFDGIVGRAPSFLRTLDTVRRVAASDATVVLEGESGTGKELLARALHRLSPRAERPLVVVNCAAIPETLLESELFGYEKGSFTGAVEAKAGRLEQAHGGTLFLDEIGELTPRLQSKLLRFLQDGELARLGGGEAVRVDVRLVAATSRDLEAMTRRHEFREDLYFRLYVVPIRIPPLRERVEDIPGLVEYFLRRFAPEATPRLDAEVLCRLQRYSWPGNVRELENLIQRLVVLCRGRRIDREQLPDHLLAEPPIVIDTDKNPFRKFFVAVPTDYAAYRRVREELLDVAAAYARRLEDAFVDGILAASEGHVARAAASSGIHRTLIYRNLKARRTHGPDAILRPDGDEPRAD